MTATTTTSAQTDAAAVALVDFIENLLTEAVERFGSVDAAREALTALMSR